MTFKNRTKFKCRKNQDFNKNEIFMEKYGKKINNYAYIQENNQDLLVYDVLEKYGCIDKIVINEKDIYADLTQIKDLRGMITQQQRAEELWKSLPLEVRQEFNNSKELFLENGEKWLEKKIKEKEPEVINDKNDSNNITNQ